MLIKDALSGVTQMRDGVLRLTIAKKEYAIKKRHNIPIT
jgi:HSP20 family molecular chaperone IbpA